MRYFNKTLDVVLNEDDFDLLPEKEKRAVKAAKELGKDKLTDQEADEVDQRYCGVLADRPSKD